MLSEELAEAAAVVAAKAAEISAPAPVSVPYMRMWLAILPMCHEYRRMSEYWLENKQRKKKVLSLVFRSHTL